MLKENFKPQFPFKEERWAVAPTVNPFPPRGSPLASLEGKWLNLNCKCNNIYGSRHMHDHREDGWGEVRCKGGNYCTPGTRKGPVKFYVYGCVKMF